MSHLFDWIIPSETSRLREAERRKSIGFFGRLSEDFPTILWMLFVIGLILGGFVAPWVIGMASIIKWVF